MPAVAFNASIERNKRLLIFYQCVTPLLCTPRSARAARTVWMPMTLCLPSVRHFFCSARRCELIEDLRWRYGATGLPREVAEKLSSREADYLRDYGDNLMQFVEEIGIDITAVRLLPC